jgi:hypothetical protein
MGCPIKTDLAIKSNFVILFSFVTMLLAYYFRNDENYEQFDKLIYLIHFPLILIFLAKNIDRNKIINIGVSACAIAILLFGLLTKDVYEQGGVKLYELWSGFGITVFIVMLILILGFLNFDKLGNFKFLQSSSFLKILTILAISVVYLLSLWQTKNSIIDYVHTQYVLNESLALSANRIPYSSFIPQYGMSYNIFTFIASKFIKIDEQLDLLMLLFFLVSVLSIVIAIKIAGLAFEANKIFVPFLLIVPFTLLTPGITRESTFGSIASLFSAIPVRLSPVIVLFFVYYLMFLKNNDSKNFVIKSVFIGVYGGLAIWNSPDFGLIGVVSLYISILITKIFKTKNKAAHLGFTSIGILVGLSLYPSLVLLFGHTIEIDFLAFFTRQFGSGFSSQPIIPIGPIIIIFPLLFILLSFHLLTGLKAKRDEKLILINAFTGVFFSTFCILGFPYFINRSIVSGQLQFFLLPISISLATMIGILIRNNFFNGLIKNFRDKDYYNFLINLPIVIFCCIPISSLILFPNPRIEITRIHEESKLMDLKLPPETLQQWPPSKIAIALDNVNLAKSFSKNYSKDVAYFGSMSNYISVKTNIQSVNVFNSPDDFLISESSLKVGCNYLVSQKFDFLILDHVASETVKRYFDIKKRSIFCDQYQFSDKLNIEPYFFLERIK